MDISQKAKQKLSSFNEKYIRIALHPDVDKRFQYVFVPDAKLPSDCEVEVSAELCVLIDESLFPFLEKTIINWTEAGKYGAGFSIDQKEK